MTEDFSIVSRSDLPRGWRAKATPSPRTLAIVETLSTTTAVLIECPRHRAKAIRTALHTYLRRKRVAASTHARRNAEDTATFFWLEPKLPTDLEDGAIASHYAAKGRR